MKLPAIQFYPGDWLRDQVAGCSLAAQGLWLRMLMIAHDSERYGYLSLNGAAMDPDTIARRCGCSRGEYDALLAELTSHGVPSVTRAKIIFSRRMVRDARARQQATIRQRRHRALEKESEDKHQQNHHKSGSGRNGSVTLASRRSSSSSSSSSSASTNSPLSPPKGERRERVRRATQEEKRAAILEEAARP